MASKDKSVSPDLNNKSEEARLPFDPSKFSVASLSKAPSPPSNGGGSLVDPSSLASKPKAPMAFGAILEEAGLVSRDMINELVRTGNESAQSLKRSLIQHGVLSEEDILGALSALAEDLGMEMIDLTTIEVTPELIDQIDPRLVKRYRVFPVSFTDTDLVVAMSDPTNVGPIDELQMLLNKHVSCVIAPEDQIEKFIRKWYEGDEIGKIYEEFTQGSNNSFNRTLEHYDTINLETEGRSEPPVVRFVSLVFRHAVHDGASDIHIEPTRVGVRIRFRIDGVLQDIPSPPKRWQNSIISRLKVLSGMDLAIKREPQDGRIRLTLPDRALDLRVSCLPSLYGETIVMRILNAATVQKGLDDVGFLKGTVNTFRRLIKSPNGVILMTGPTGSGKTTTLNAALGTLNNTETKIITVEDPVEYQIPGINQIQVNEEVGLNFPTALRSMLRMSPDVIMVGEIRDIDTAEIAVRAALTGHLVFSTLHTNDAPSATIRLIDMGVKPFLVATSIQAVIAQRLIRRICTNCKKPITVHPEALTEMGMDPNKYADGTFYKGAGCERCNTTGYRGRVAIHEIFEMDPELRKMVVRSESTYKIKKVAIAHGMRTLRVDGFEKVLIGWTTIEEIMHSTQMD